MKLLETFLLTLTTMQQFFLSDRAIGFLALEAGQKSKCQKNSGNFEICKFNLKNAKIRDIKMFKKMP